MIAIDALTRPTLGLSGRVAYWQKCQSSTGKVTALAPGATTPVESVRRGFGSPELWGVGDCSIRTPEGPERRMEGMSTA
jgi:hypothetical protein